MAFEGNSLLEGIMRKALQAENIPYKEQYRVYEKTGDLKPKYTLDFLVYTDNYKINVECDGWAYHKQSTDRNNDVLRDSWLSRRGINQIIRFDTIDIKYNINGCINKLKMLLMNNSDISYELKPENPFIEEYRKINRSGFIMNTDNITGLHKVNIYTATCALSHEKKGKGAIAYQLEDATLQVLGNENTIAYSNINKKQCQALVILESLRKMKMSANLTIFTETKWVASVGNNSSIELATRNIDNRDIWLQIKSELEKHNYKFVYTIENNNKIYRNLLSRSKQKAYRALDTERVTL